MGHIWALHC